MEAAAPGCSRSSDLASRSSTRAARSAESRFHASRNALPTEACSRSGQMADDVPPLMDLAALHHAARTEDVGNGPAQPRSAIYDEQQRPVRRQSARHQVAEQAGGDGSRFGGAFAQAQHVFPALCVDPQRDHHAVVPEDLAVDADHPQVQLAQRPAKKRLEALCRQRHEPPRHGAARRRPLGHVGRHRVQRARVPARRYPGGDRGQRMLVQRVGGRRPLEARQRDFALGAPHPLPWQLDLPSAERHLAVDTAAAPRGPLDLMAPLRATQHFPVRLHHRLQNLQTGRDAQAMECFPDTVDHAEDRQRHLDRDGSRVGGLAGRLPPVMLRHGWQSPFRLHPLSYHRTGAGAATRFTSAQVQQRPGHPRECAPTRLKQAAVHVTDIDEREPPDLALVRLRSIVDPTPGTPAPPASENAPLPHPEEVDEREVRQAMQVRMNGQATDSVSDVRAAVTDVETTSRRVDSARRGPTSRFPGVFERPLHEHEGRKRDPGAHARSVPSEALKLGRAEPAGSDCRSRQPYGFPKRLPFIQFRQWRHRLQPAIQHGTGDVDQSLNAPQCTACSPQRT